MITIDQKMFETLLHRMPDVFGDLAMATTFDLESPEARTAFGLARYADALLPGSSVVEVPQAFIERFGKTNPEFDETYEAYASKDASFTFIVAADYKSLRSYIMVGDEFLSSEGFGLDMEFRPAFA